MNKKDYEVIIAGAGASGIGLGILLKKLPFEDFLILEKGEIASSFRNWPKETRFISPSFTGNFFGSVDLNSISPDTSPAFTLETEHPNGAEYASYLTKVAKHFELPIKTGVEVNSIKKGDDIFEIETSDGAYSSKALVWAAGEFAYPNKPSFEGAKYCTHFASINSYEDIEGEEIVVIGGYESGMDALIELSRLGKRVTVIDQEEPWRVKVSDSSIALAPFTFDKLRSVLPDEEPILVGNQKVVEVAKDGDKYEVFTENGESYYSDGKPILATGFTGSTSLVRDLFEWDDDNLKPSLTEQDESTTTPGLFLIGPEVRHSKVIFCFIYKFRQRFPIVAKAIMDRLGKEATIPEEYKQDGMLLDDLSCCLDECSC